MENPGITYLDCLFYLYLKMKEAYMYNTYRLFLTCDIMSSREHLTFVLLYLYNRITFSGYQRYSVLPHISVFYIFPLHPYLTVCQIFSLPRSFFFIQTVFRQIALLISHPLNDFLNQFSRNLWFAYQIPTSLRITWKKQVTINVICSFALNKTGGMALPHISYSNYMVFRRRPPVPSSDFIRGMSI